MATFRRYTGSAWTKINTVKRYTGSAWTSCSSVKKYNGSAWVKVWPECSCYSACSCDCDDCGEDCPCVDDTWEDCSCDCNDCDDCNYCEDGCGPGDY